METFTSEVLATLIITMTSGVRTGVGNAKHHTLFSRFFRSLIRTSLLNPEPQE